MDLDAVSDAEVIRRSEGDPRSFVVLFERHHGAVRRYLARRVGDELADELAAETFARAFKQRSRFRSEHESGLPWLYGIGGKLIGEHRRAEKRRLRALERLAVMAGADAGGAGAETAVVSPEVFRALRGLPAGERHALLLVAWGELSYQEAARALDVPVGTVRSRIARARKRLEGPLSSNHLMATVPGEHHA
jgi:RNA polymerase sigma-70 factor (ECF subfamily)